MSKELTTEEKARVFAMYGLKAECRMTTGGNPNQVLFIKHLTLDGLTIASADSLLKFNCGYGCNYNQVHLLLTPISEITDEDDNIRCEIMNTYEGDGIGWAYMYQFLISRSYAVPLFFSPGHWANGKTALDLNIAIKKQNS